MSDVTALRKKPPFKTRYVLLMLVIELIISLYDSWAFEFTLMMIGIILFIFLLAFVLVTMIGALCWCFSRKKTFRFNRIALKRVMTNMLFILIPVQFPWIVDTITENKISKQNPFEVLGCVMSAEITGSKSGRNIITVNTPTEPELHIITYKRSIINKLDTRRGECFTFNVYKHGFIVPNVGSTHLLNVEGIE